MSLSPSDQTHLEAAQGWLGLGNWREANEELDRITPTMRAHPDVLCIRWTVCSKARNWKLAVEIARKLAEADPDDSFGLVRLSWSLDELGRVQEAYDLLARAVNKYPEDYRLRYSLARYCSKSGKLKEAMHYLETAIDYGCKEKHDLRQRALDDPAFEPLWLNISEI